MQVHPSWRVSHQLPLLSRLRDDKAMESWGQTRDHSKNGACNYIGCDNPRHSEEASLVSFLQVRQDVTQLDAPAPPASQPNSQAASAGASNVWMCEGDSKITAHINTKTTKSGIKLVAKPSKATRRLGLDAVCAKAFLKHIGDLIQTQIKEFKAKISDVDQFKSYSDWMPVAKQVMACTCSGTADADKKGVRTYEKNREMRSPKSG